MGRYLEGKRMGKNVQRLMLIKVGLLAVPFGSSNPTGKALTYLTDRNRMKAINQEAMIWVEQALDAMLSAPDNPYGNDDEAIAAAYLKELKNRYPGEFNDE